MIGGEKIGSVFIRANTNEVTRFLLISIGIVLSVLLISLFLCWSGAVRLQNHIAAPLERLVDGSVSMAEGDLSTQVDVQSDDEMGVWRVHSTRWC